MPDEKNPKNQQKKEPKPPPPVPSIKDLAGGLIDSHAHVMAEYFGEEQAAIIERAFAENLSALVNPAVTVDGMDELLGLAERYDKIFLGIGQHPHEAKDWDDAMAGRLEAVLEHPKVVAVGECGLDYYYNNSLRDQQLAAFGAQIDLAVRYDKPIIVHCRDAWEDAFTILKERGKGKLRGVFHCFTGGPQHLAAIADLDFYVSFSGILTYSSAKEIQAAAPLVSEERILVETDCPFLAPQKVRGLRNEPAYVWFTAEKLAALRGLDLAHLVPKLTANTRELFRI